jgi:3-hydroxyethyl bacteriochlorophyllide a dehydrogenase
MHTLAVIVREPERLELGQVTLAAPGDADLVVAVSASGISTGTERLLVSGRMPPFPGMGYPLVPGYETVGEVVEAGPAARHPVGARVFVPGSRGFTDAHGLFGGAAASLVVDDARAVTLPDSIGDEGVLLALAATAHHAVIACGHAGPALVVGHGVLGRLIARVAIALGHAAPTVHETNAARRQGAAGYDVRDPATDTRRDYPVIVDVSGDAGLVDPLIGRLARGGLLVLAGFYEAPIQFAFPPAFMKEARLSIAAEWTPADLSAVLALAADGRLSLDGLITHRRAATDAPDAYRTAFGDPACLKMVLDWRHLS